MARPEWKARHEGGDGPTLAALGTLGEEHLSELIEKAFTPPLQRLEEITKRWESTWATGGQAELHIWAGGFHGFDALYPQAPISAAARRTRNEWLARVLSEVR